MPFGDARSREFLALESQSRIARATTRTHRSRRWSFGATPDGTQLEPPADLGTCRRRTATALAEELGVHRATVFSLLRRAGVQTRYRILSDEDIAVARTMYDEGQSLTSIGEHFGVSGRTALNVFRRHGIPTRARGTNQWTQKAALPTEQLPDRR